MRALLTLITHQVILGVLDFILGADEERLWCGFVCGSKYIKH